MDVPGPMFFINRRYVIPLRLNCYLAEWNYVFTIVSEV